MNEWTYDISIGADIIARNVPEQYLMVVIKALLEAYHSDPNIAVLVSRCDDKEG